MNMEHKTLVGLLQLPAVREFLNPNVLAGLSGCKQIDYALGVIETAVQASPENQTLSEGYQALQKEYPLYFGVGKRRELYLEDVKPETYKSSNGF